MDNVKIKIFPKITNFPYVGQEVPEGASDCLAGLTFVISGTLDR